MYQNVFKTSRKRPRNLEIIEYKKQNAVVGTILNEIAARKATIVHKTLFDVLVLSNNLFIKIIDERLNAPLC